MRYPLVICSHGKLIIAAADFFDGIGRLEVSTGILEVNVAQDGRVGFEWILDADGIFFDLTSEGLLPLKLLQRIGLSRARERFRIAPGRQVTAGEIRDRIANLHNQFEEAPNVTDLKNQTASLSSGYVLKREDMLRYLGE